MVPHNIPQVTSRDCWAAVHLYTGCDDDTGIGHHRLPWEVLPRADRHRPWSPIDRRAVYWRYNGYCPKSLWHCAGELVNKTADAQIADNIGFNKAGQGRKMNYATGKHSLSNTQ